MEGLAFIESYTGDGSNVLRRINACSMKPK